METWKNYYLAKKVKEIIDKNFIILENQCANAILALSTEKRNLINSTYLKNGLIIFDTTLQKWLCYNDGKWVDYSFPNRTYSRNIYVSDWSNGVISIPFSEHLSPNPIVQLFVKTDNSYNMVIDGIDIDENYNIKLLTDLAFEGKVVIK